VTIGNKIYLSDWGANWTEAAFSPAPENITSLAFYNNPYVTIGNKIYLSDWGVNWTEAAFSPIPNTISDISVLSNSKTFSIYPNPTNDNITIATTQTKITQNLVLFIYDMQGLLLLQQSLHQEKTGLNISGLAKGVYVFILSSSEKTEVIRVVKE